METTDISALTREAKLKFLDVIAADGPWDYQDQLLQLVKDEDPQIRERAAAPFWDLADPTYMDLLLEMAESDPVVAVRAAAISALGRYVYEGFVMEELNEADFDRVRTVLLQFYNNPAEDLSVRRSSLEALGFITEEEMEEIIREAYQSPEPLMRLTAVFAMGRSGTRTWDDILAAEMKNPDPAMRFEAVRSAGETFMSRAAETLEQLTRDPDREVRIAAIDALGKAGRPHSRTILRSLLNSPDEDIRDAASDALDELDMFESEQLSDETD